MVFLAPLAAMIVQMAISRTREYEADRIGAEICGRPLWLATALENIQASAARIDNVQAENNPATAHMFIINPLHARAVDGLFRPIPRRRTGCGGCARWRARRREFAPGSRRGNPDGRDRGVAAAVPGGTEGLGADGVARWRLKCRTMTKPASGKPMPPAGFPKGRRQVSFLAEGPEAIFTTVYSDVADVFFSGIAHSKSICRDVAEP